MTFAHTQKGAEKSQDNNANNDGETSKGSLTWVNEHIALFSSIEIRSRR